ncbi:MAG: hypothetical protein ACR2FU_15720 [Streptosporangiaceae bacterium]
MEQTGTAADQAPGQIGTAPDQLLDPADQRSVVAEGPAMRAGDVAAAFGRARAGLRFYPRLKTAAVRSAW